MRGVEKTKTHQFNFDRDLPCERPRDNNTFTHPTSISFSPTSSLQRCRDNSQDSHPQNEPELLIANEVPRRRVAHACVGVVAVSEDYEGPCCCYSEPGGEKGRGGWAEGRVVVSIQGCEKKRGKGEGDVPANEAMVAFERAIVGQRYEGGEISRKCGGGDERRK